MLTPSKVKQHVVEHKRTYLAFGGGMVITSLGVIIFTRTNMSANATQVIQQIAWRPENTQTVVTLLERSTPSCPVHLVGTNLYFDSLSEAARQTGHSLSMISRNVNGHIADVKGDVFERLELA